MRAQTFPPSPPGRVFEEAFRIMQECNCPGCASARQALKRLVGLLTPEKRHRVDDDSIGDAASPHFVKISRWWGRDSVEPTNSVLSCDFPDFQLRQPRVNSPPG